MAKDYYSILGVGRDASDDDIKRAFRKLAQQHHPDKPTGDEAKFKEINQAYQVLSDPEKRKKYDQFGAGFEQMGGGPGGFDFGGGGINFDFGDFSDMFGSVFGGGRRTRHDERRGRNIEMDLPLAFREAAFGTEKELRLYRNLKCDQCAGAGAEKNSKVIDCLQCGGSGQMRRVQQTILGHIQTVTPCSRCGGAGRVPEKACGRCGGKGIVKGTRELRIKVPAGIDEGEVLRIAGEGEAAPAGSESGDLYVSIRINPDRLFRRNGHDIRSRIEISFVRAALGGAIAVETLDGPVDLKIPAGTQSDQVFRLRGRGMQQLKKSGRGDHYVEVAVKIPSKLTKEQRRILEAWDSE